MLRNSFSRSGKARMAQVDRIMSISEIAILATPSACESHSVPALIDVGATQARSLCHGIRLAARQSENGQVIENSISEIAILATPSASSHGAFRR